MPSNATIMEFIKKTAEPITNKFMLAPPSASAINIRRNSSHQCHPHDAGSNDPIASHTQSTTNPTHMEPPPVPKRTFLGKIMTSRPTGAECTSPSASIKMTFNNVCKQTLEEVKRRNGSSSSKQIPPHQSQSHQTTRKLVENHYPIDDDDDRLSIESSVFEEPKSSDPIIFAASSNRSSSDSNKSHITIDTGYMSASNDTDRIFFGASEDFRSRFSSVDTQSSIDSCTSSDMPTQHSFNLQSQARCIISPLAAKRDEYEEKFTAKLSKSFSRMNSASSLLVPLGKTPNINSKPCAVQNNCDTIRRMPPMSTKNQQQQAMAKTFQPQYSLNNNNTGIYPKSRPMPAPPISAHDTTDAERNLYNGTSMLGAFQCGLARITSAAASTSEVMMGRKSFKSQMNAFNQKTPIAKSNQRQDSSISGDSFSMTSSPGFNTKAPTMEVPMLQHAVKRNNNRNNNSLDTIDGTAFAGTKYNFAVRPAVRHDSTLSSDSVSQTSSPGYTTKLEQPLLAQAIKIHASKLMRWFEFIWLFLMQIIICESFSVKQHLKCVDEIANESSDHQSPITKSASTPASLQTIVRFQNGSNMSLQHKVGANAMPDAKISWKLFSPSFGQVVNRRKSSNPYITRGRLKFRLLQILLNALALLIIAGE